jgi:hypothetical protein
VLASRCVGRWAFGSASHIAVGFALPLVLCGCKAYGVCCAHIAFALLGGPCCAVLRRMRQLSLQRSLADLYGLNVSSGCLNCASGRHITWLYAVLCTIFLFLVSHPSCDLGLGFVWYPSLFQARCAARQGPSGVVMHKHSLLVQAVHHGAPLSWRCSEPVSGNV